MNAQQSTTPATAHVKMFANLEQQPPFLMPIKGDTKQAALSIHSHLKGQNARIGLDRVMALIEGRENMYKGYEVVDIGTHNDHAAKLLSPQGNPQAAPAPAPNPGQSTAQPSKPVAARGAGRNYAPFSGRKWTLDPNAEKKVVPLKRGTLGTRLMEFMFRPEGASHKFMVDHSGNSTPGGVNDVLGWQIKEKGYGLRYDTAKGTYHLVLPEGQKELIYA